jgi:hypothetical protein
MHLFDKDMQFEKCGQFRCMGTVSDKWSINGIPNGGYLMALTSNAMQIHSNKKSTPIVTANYMSRCVPGSAEFHVEFISQSMQFERLEARLFQDGKEKIRALGTFADEKNECVLER